MPTNVWQGTAPDVAQIQILTPANTIESGDLFKATIGSKTFTYASTATTIASVCSGFVTAWTTLSATEYPEFAEITATNNSTSITLTAVTAGIPFLVTPSTVEADGSTSDNQTFTSTTAGTTSSGANHWNTAGNWSLGTVPVTGDDVYIENNTVDIKYGLAQSAVTLTSLNIGETYTGKIGLPNVNASNYYEYRERYLEIGATTINSQADSGRIKINTGSIAGTVNVTGTGTATETDIPAFLFKGTNAANVVNINKGDVGIAFFAGETATVATLRVAYQSQVANDVTLVCGSGTTLTTINQSGGTVTTASNATTLTMTAGTHYRGGASTVTTLNVNGGKCYYNSTGTVTTAHVSAGGELNFSQNLNARTVTTANVYTQGSLQDPFRTVTWTNPIRLQYCAIGDVQIDVGTHVTLQVAAGP